MKTPWPPQLHAATAAQLADEEEGLRCVVAHRCFAQGGGKS
jgi:hypothetical protein